MDTALKKMLAFGKTRHLELAALKDARSGYLHPGKTTVTFGNGSLPIIEARDKTSAKLRHLCKGMGLAALVHCLDRCSLMHSEGVRFEVPVRVRSSGRSDFANSAENFDHSTGIKRTIKPEEFGGDGQP
jgi:hypothetical protein